MRMQVIRRSSLALSTSFVRTAMACSRMGNRDVFDGDASVFAEVPKMMASKCSFEVGDNAVRETESMDDIFEELDCFLCSSRD